MYLRPVRSLAGCVYGVLVCNVQPHSRGQLARVSERNNNKSDSNLSDNSFSDSNLSDSKLSDTNTNTMHDYHDDNDNHHDHFPHCPPMPLRLDANYFDDDRDAVVMFNAMKGSARPTYESSPSPPPLLPFSPPPPPRIKNPV